MKKSLRILSLFLICSMLSSCIFLLISNVKRKAKKEFTVENGAIPEYFGRYGATMLVEKVQFHKAFNKRLEKNFERKYIGPFKVIDYGDAQQDLYKDVEKYRYIFKSEPKKIDGFDGVYTVYNHSIYDRVSKKVYRGKYNNTGYGKVILGYIENLNDEIKANN